MFRHSTLIATTLLLILPSVTVVAESEQDTFYTVDLESSNDITLKAKVHAALHTEPRLVTAPEVMTDSNHGIVVLKGLVRNDEYALRVCELVHQIDGVKEVRDNLIRVNDNNSAPQAAP